MAVKSAAYYWIVCDKCGISSTASSEHSAWSDEVRAIDDALDSD